MERGDRLEQVQMLRGIAALAVFIFHLGIVLDPFTPAELRLLVQWGSAGVDVFFVISGFVMAHSVRELAGPAAAVDFLLRRLWRIAPLLFILTFVLIWMSAARGQSFDVARIVNCFTILPVMRSPHEFQYALVAAWTLGYELAFYLVIAAVVALNLRRRLFATAAILCVLPLLSAAKPFSDSLMIEFAFGLAAYAFWKRTDVSPPCAWAALGTAAFLCAFPMGESRFLNWGLPAAFLFLAVLGWKPRKTTRTVGIWLGNISYSMYLSHLITFSLLTPVAAFLPLAAAAILLAGGGILMSWLVYEAAEAPLQRLQSRATSRQRVQAAA